jgi:putative endonuclease
MTTSPVNLSHLHIPEPPEPMLDNYAYMYMMSSSSRRAVYTGVTTFLQQRVYEHKYDLQPGFTRKYKCHRLVYFERYANITAAIAWEKEVKGWRREKKNALVESMNPTWKDLSEGWFKEMRGSSKYSGSSPQVPLAQEKGRSS